MLDYGSIMLAGQRLVPDLQEEMFKAEQNRALVDQRRAAAAVNQFKLQQEQDKQQRQAAFQRDVAFAVQSGDPKQISALMVKYPEFADQIKPGWDAYSKEGRQQNLTQLGTAYTRAQNGDYEGAAQILERRYEADKAAGVADEETPQVIAALRSGDPMKQKTALGTLGIYLSAADPDKFGETFGKLNAPESRSAFGKEYDDRVARFGEQSAKEWAAAQNVVVGPPEGVVIDKRDYARPISNQSATAPARQSEGGDQSDPRQGVPAPALNPQTGLPTTLSKAQYDAVVKAKGKEQTDAWMQRNGITVTEDGGPVKVRSLQEARNLPSGTVFITPDGRTMRKP